MNGGNVESRSTGQQQQGGRRPRGRQQQQQQPPRLVVDSQAAAANADALLLSHRERENLLGRRKDAVCAIQHPGRYARSTRAERRASFRFYPERCQYVAPRDEGSSSSSSSRGDRGSSRRRRHRQGESGENDNDDVIASSPPSSALPEWWEREIRQLEDIERDVFGTDPSIHPGAATDPASSSTTIFHLPRVLTAPPAPLDHMTAYMLVNGFAVYALPRVTSASSIRSVPNARRRLQSAMNDFSRGALLTYPREVQDDALAVAAKAAKAAHMIRVSR